MDNFTPKGQYLETDIGNIWRHLVVILGRKFYQHYWEEARDATNKYPIIHRAAFQERLIQLQMPMVTMLKSLALKEF